MPWVLRELRGLCALCIVIGIRVSQLSQVFLVPNSTCIALLLHPGHLYLNLAVSFTPSLRGADFALNSHLCLYFVPLFLAAEMVLHPTRPWSVYVSHLSRLPWLWWSCNIEDALVEVWGYPTTLDSPQALSRHT